MKKLITTLQNIWKIKELRERILFTLAMLAVFRFGSYVTLPGIDVAALDAMNAGNTGGANDLLGLINVFTGGAFNQAAVFALGIMPYITASIIIQLLGFAVPYFQRLQQREGESGRKKINQITRFLTVAITLVQGSAYLAFFKSQGVVNENIPEAIFWGSNIIVLSAGTIFAMWLGERITDKGIGNGVSLLITVGIIATLPQMLIFEFQSQLDNNGLFIFVLELGILFVIVGATVAIVQAVRRIPVQFAKHMATGGGGRAKFMNPSQKGMDTIGLKLNAAGVMPIIFAQALMFIPGTLAQAVGGESTGLLATFNDFTSVPYNIVYFFMVVIFTYVYTALVVNPKNYADYLRRQDAYIPGIQPGKATADYIDAVTTRITLPGSIFLALIAIMPAFAAGFGVNQGFAMFFGGTSLLILVAVVLDTLGQIESHLKMNRMGDFGKIRGKRSRFEGIGANM